jgi:Nuclease-related domain
MRARGVAALNVFDWEHFDERERVRAGDEAEIHVRQVISSHEQGVILRGPLIPHINEQNQIEGFRETDLLVYTQGNVFCVEVKYYSGTVTYLPVPGGYDDNKIVQIKPSHHGEVVREVYTNPLKKTKSFISVFKRYMSQIEPRFEHLFLIPVVCFGEKADISAIYNFQEGIVQIQQLSAFFDYHRNPQFATNPSQWIIDAILHKVPNWDRVLTVEGEWSNGILSVPYLTFMGPDHRAHRLPPYASIGSIDIERVRPKVLQLNVSFIDGSRQVFEATGGEVSLGRGGDPQTYRLEELQKLVIGLENKMVHGGQ